MQAQGSQMSSSSNLDMGYSKKSVVSASVKKIDPKIIEGCVNKDRKSQSDLYQILSPKLYPICLRYANDSHQAMDFLHDSFVQIFNKIESYRNKGSFEGWTKRVTINVALMSIRKNKKLIFQDGIESNEVSIIEIESEKKSIDISLIMKLVEGLPSGCKTVFLLYEIDGFSHEEISKQLGVTTGTTKSQLFKARKLLKEMIRNHE